MAGRYNVAKGRYEVTVEGEAEAVLLKPASLQDMRQASANAPSAVPAARPPGEQVPTTRDGTLCEPTPAPRDVWVAAQSGDLQQVIEWLHMGGHVDARAEDGRGLLHFAAYSGQLRVAEELLQRGANVDLWHQRHHCSHGGCVVGQARHGAPAARAQGGHRPADR